MRSSARPKTPSARPERAEREAAIKEEEERERKEKEAEAAELERKATRKTPPWFAARRARTPKGSKVDLSTAAGAKAHLFARDEAEGSLGRPPR